MFDGHVEISAVHLAAIVLTAMAVGMSWTSSVMSSWVAPTTLAFLRGPLTALLVAVIASVGSIYIRTSQRAHRREIARIRQLLDDPKTAASILGSDLPRWLVFPETERSLWFSKVAKSLWQTIGKSLSGTLTSTLKWVFESYKPSFLTRLELSSISMGTASPDILGVCASAQDTETVIDLDLQWVSNAEVRVLAAVGPVVVETIVTEIQLKGLVRVILGPHCPVWPAFAAISVSFIGKPTIDFCLKSAKLQLDAIPGLSSWLDMFLRDTIAWLMVYPRKYSYQIVDPSYGRPHTSSEAVGTLVVNVLSAKGLPDPGLFSSADTYAKIRVSSKPLERRTKTVYNNRSPTYEAEPALFLVRNTPKEELQLTICHESKKIAGANLNAFAEDKILAHFKVDLPLLMKAPGLQSWNMTLISDTKKQAEGGEISFTTEFKAFRADDAVVALEDGITGALFVHLIGCKDLVKADAFGLSDPFVVLTLDGCRAKSKTIMKTLDPVFDETMFLLFSNAIHSSLDVKVYDYDLMSADELIGTVSIPLAPIVQANQHRVKREWALDPQGEIHMELKLLLH